MIKKQNPSSVIYSILPLYNHPAVQTRATTGKRYKKNGRAKSKPTDYPTHTTINPTIPPTTTAHPFQTRSSPAAPGEGVVLGTAPLLVVFPGIKLPRLVPELPLVPLPVPLAPPLPDPDPDPDPDEEDEFDPPGPAAPVGTPVSATDLAASLYASRVRAPDVGGLIAPTIPPWQCLPVAQ